MVVAMFAWDIYDFLITNDGIRYYSSNPQRLVFPIFLGVVIGTIAFAISRLSTDTQRRVKVGSLATLGVLLSAALIYFAFQIVQLAAVTREWGWILVAFGGLLAIVCLVWWEFRRVSKAT